MNIYLSLIVLVGRVEDEKEVALSTHCHGNIVAAETPESASEATLKLVQKDFNPDEGWEVKSTLSTELDPERLQDILNQCRGY